MVSSRRERGYTGERRDGYGGEPLSGGIIAKLTGTVESPGLNSAA